MGSVGAGPVYSSIDTSYMSLGSLVGHTTILDMAMVTLCTSLRESCLFEILERVNGLKATEYKGVSSSRKA